MSIFHVNKTTYINLYCYLYMKNQYYDTDISNYMVKWYFKARHILKYKHMCLSRPSLSTNLRWVYMCASLCGSGGGEHENLCTLFPLISHLRRWTRNIFSREFLATTNPDRLARLQYEVINVTPQRQNGKGKLGRVTPNLNKKESIYDWGFVGKIENGRL